MATVALTPIQEAFQEALGDFKKKVGNDEKFRDVLQTSKAEDVYKAMEDLQKRQAKSYGLLSLDRISPFLDNLRDYAAVIEVFVQVKPDILALIWGPIKLILQWAGVWKKSCETMIKVIADIGYMIPKFGEYTKLFGDKQGFKKLLHLFFKDLLDFYEIALKFFTLPQWRALFDTTWPRQRAKIEVVIEHIKRDNQLLENQVQWEHIQQEHQARLNALKSFESSEKEHLKQEYRSLRNHVFPMSYDTTLNRIHGHFCKGTGDWLMKDASFTKWLNASSTSPNLLWLQGIPGSGKTFLSSLVVGEAKKITDHVAFAFLSHEQSQISALSVINSLIFQLTEKDDDLQEVLCKSDHKDLKNNLDIAQKLLGTLVDCSGPTYIVVDGIDETEEFERQRLLKCLLKLLDSYKRLNVLLSSRKEADIDRLLKNKPYINVNEKNSASIQRFITEFTKDWFEESDFPKDLCSEISNLLIPLAFNAKGMFLYASVVLKNIKSLNDPDEIKNELIVLPKDLHDAYLRILTRINNLQPEALRKKAIKIIGWVGCSPGLLTRQELEHAVKINLEVSEDSEDINNDSYQYRGKKAPLNIPRICGPIVEENDGMLQFIHFTVKEYFFSSKISGSIDFMEARQSLAICCMRYFCLPHHDPRISDEEIQGGVFSGSYRFHNFAIRYWIKLLRLCTVSKESEGIPERLKICLNTLINMRLAQNIIGGREVNDNNHEFSALKDTDLGLFNILCEMTNFDRACSESDYNRIRKWVNKDPFTLSSTSVRIHQQMKNLLDCGDLTHKNCKCLSIKEHHGSRAYFCWFISCPFSRLGFDSDKSRQSHLNDHQRPWKCSDKDCEFSKGFLSRQMRDQHWKLYHKNDLAAKRPLFATVDKDELVPLLFDFISANSVDDVKNLLQNNNVTERVYKRIANEAAACASPEMLEMIDSGFFSMYSEDQWYYKCAHIETASKARNEENFRFILSKSNIRDLLHGTELEERDKDVDKKFLIFISRILKNLFKSDSEPMWDDWNSFEQAQIAKIPDLKRLLENSYFQSSPLKAIKGNINREQKLLDWLAKTDIVTNHDHKRMGMALKKVATVACSSRVVEYLIEHGAEVDYLGREGPHTPLQGVSIYSSFEAAQIMKLLLYNGANFRRPMIMGRRIEDQKGPRNLRRTLGMSWDELLQDVESTLHKKD